MIAVPIALAGLSVALAGFASTPHTFVAGNLAVAEEVNRNFAAHAAAINDNDARLNTVESQGVLAMVHVEGSGTPTVTRSENRVSNTAITVSRTPGFSTGIYSVDFGFDVSDRFYFATPGSSDASQGVGAAMISAKPLTGNVNAVRVEIKTASGLADSRFFLMIR